MTRIALLLALLVMPAFGQVTRSERPDDFIDRPNPQPERRIVFAMPAPPEHQREYVEAIERLGLAPYADYCLQVNSWHSEAFPDEIPLDGIGVAVAADRSVRRHGWSPKAATWIYYDYEPDKPDGRSWLWQKVLRGFDGHDYAFADRAFAQLAEWRDEHLPGAKVGFYGVPTTPRNQGVWTIHDMPYLTGVVRFLRDAEWVAHNLYPRADILEHGIPEADEAKHREHVLRNYAVLRALFPGKPVVPMIGMRPDIDYGRYFAVYLGAIGETDADTVMLWVNPGNPDKMRHYVRGLEQAAPHLRAWVKSGPARPAKNIPLRTSVPSAASAVDPRTAREDRD